MNYLIIGQRQSGKTHLAIYEFMKNPTKSLLIVGRIEVARHCLDLITRQYKVDQDDLMEIKSRIRSLHAGTFRGEAPETVIFDEYLYSDETKRQEGLKEAVMNAKDVYVFSSKPSKIGTMYKAAKKEIKALKKAGFVTPFKLRSFNPETVKRVKKEEQYILLTRKAEKMGYQLTKKVNEDPGTTHRFLAGYQGDAVTVSADKDAPVTCSVTNVNPNTPFTYTNSTNAPEFSPKPGVAKRAIKAVQGKLDFPGESKQLSLFD